LNLNKNIISEIILINLSQNVESKNDVYNSFNMTKWFNLFRFWRYDSTFCVWKTKSD